MQMVHPAYIQKKVAVHNFYMGIFLIFIGLLFWAQFYNVLPKDYPVWGVVFTLAAVWLFIKAFWVASK